MSDIVAYYRLGDPVNSNSAQDFTGNGNVGSLIDGATGTPAFGFQGVFLYDTDCALDLTNGQNSPGGGFSTDDETTSPPTVHDPLANATEWTVEMWFQYTGDTTYLPAPAIVPPGLTTPISRPTNFPGGIFSATAAASVIFSGTYAAVGDLAILGIVVLSPTITVSSLFGTTSADWTLQVRNQDAVNGRCCDIWTAPTVSVAAPDVVTITYSDDVSGVGMYAWVDSMTVAQGANTIWSYPDMAVYQSAVNVTTAVYPALLADGSTNPQAYWGLGSSSGAMHGGTTPGFTYVDISDSEITYNLDVFSGDNPYEPTTSTGSGNFVTVGIIIEASISTAASTAAIGNGTLFRAIPNEFQQLDFPSYELQVGFAQVNGDLPGTLGTISNAIIEGFSETNDSNIWSFSTNPLDGSWHHIVKSSGLTTSVGGIEYVGVPYLDGAAPVGAVFSTAIGGSITGLTFGTQPQNIAGINVNENGPNSQPFAGAIDEVALYSGNLSLAQITQHFDTALWFQQVEFGAQNGAASVDRLNKVLAVSGLNPEMILRVPYPWLTEIYAETDLLTTTSALNYLQTTSQTEPGIIFQGPDGYIYAYNREYQYVNGTTTTSQAVFSDSDNSNYYYEGTTLAITGDDLDLWNTAEVQSGYPATSTTEQIEVGVLQSWGPPQSPTLAQSASVYGNRTLQGLTSLQMAQDSFALQLAQWLTAIYYQPIERVTQMTLNSEGNGGANISQMLQRGLFDQITIQYTGQTPGPTFSQNCVIEQVSTMVDMANPDWDTTWSTSPYELLLSPFYLDSSILDSSVSVLTL